MKPTRRIAFVVIGMSSVLLACRLLGEPFYNQLELRNSSDRAIKVLLNLAYPDSSLRLAHPDIRVDPHNRTYVGRAFNLKRGDGVTIFVFDYDYYKNRWHEGVGTPDTYLEDERILSKYYLSRGQLDSLGWSLEYP